MERSNSVRVELIASASPIFSPPTSSMWFLRRINEVRAELAASPSPIFAAAASPISFPHMLRKVRVELLASASPIVMPASPILELSIERDVRGIPPASPSASDDTQCSGLLSHSSTSVCKVEWKANVFPNCLACSSFRWHLPMAKVVSVELMARASKNPATGQVSHKHGLTMPREARLEAKLALVMFETRNQLISTGSLNPMSLSYAEESLWQCCKEGATIRKMRVGSLDLSRWSKVCSREREQPC